MIDNRNQNIDYLKAFGIYLVILGHLIENLNENFDNNILFKFIYSIHMPLFIFLSGVLIDKNKILTRDFLQKKTEGLLLPFLVWALIKSITLGFINKSIFINTFVKTLLYPDNGLWFLVTLFWINIIYFICNYFLENKLLYFYLFVFLGNIIIILFKFDNIFALKQSFYLLPFFILGYTLRNYFSTFNNYFILLTISFFLFTFKFWTRIDSSQNSIFLYLFFNIKKLFISFSGVVGFYYLFNKINCHLKYVQKVGESTLSIYALHFFFINQYHFIFQNYYIPSLLLYSMFVLVICYYTSNIIFKFPILSYFLFGKKIIII